MKTKWKTLLCCFSGLVAISLLIFTISRLLNVAPSSRQVPTFTGGVHVPLSSNLFGKLAYLKLTYDHQLSEAENLWLWKPKTSTREASVKGHLKVHPLEILNGETVEVSWAGLDIDVKHMVLALYCPFTSPNDKLIDLWPLNKHHNGRIRISLYNVRMECQFRMYSNSTVGTVVATSDTIKFRDAMETPEHGHLALTGDPHEMRVQWNSGAKYTPEVWYGHSPSKLTQFSTGSSRTYSTKDFCGPPANLSAHFVDPGQLHDVLLSGLKPDTKYFYKYGNEHYKFSTVSSFTTAPLSSSDTKVKFVLYGDMGISPWPGAEATMMNIKQEVQAGGISFVLHIGDLSYAYGLGYIWDTWMTMIEPVASAVPYMVSVGNHEQDTLVGGEKDPSKEKLFLPPWGNYGHDSGGECGVPVFYRFHMPDNGNHVFWYSFAHGPVAMIQLSSEHNYTAGSKQYTWLQSTLKRIDRQATPWVIVTAHRPLYCSSKYVEDHNTAIGMQKAFEDVLVSYGVDIFIGGHLHVYERTCRMYKSKCSSDKGIVHIVAGAAGFGLHSGEQFDDKEWSMFFKLAFGYGRITASKNSLLWEYVENAEGKVIDSLLLNK